MDAESFRLLQDACGDALPLGGIGGPQDRYSHVSYEVDPPRRWNMDPSKVGDFWIEYSSIVEDKRGTLLMIAEKTEEYNPLVVEATLHFVEDPMAHLNTRAADYAAPLFNDKFIYGLIHYMQQSMGNVLTMNDRAMCEIACVLLPSDQNGDSTWKSTFQDTPTKCTTVRIFFPYCKCDNAAQKRILKDAITSIYRGGQFSNLFPSGQPVGDWKQILTLPATNDALTLYGSVDKRGKCPLYIEHMYSAIGYDNFMNSTVTLRKLFEIFNPLSHSIFSKGQLSSTDIAVDDYDRWVPLLFSIGYNPIVSFAKAEAPVGEQRGSDLLGDETPLAVAKHLLQFLAPKRANEYVYWMDVGKALYHATENTPGASDHDKNLGHEVWKQWTSRYSTAFAPEECSVYRYHRFRDAHITYKTIAWYARMDDPASYSRWHKAWVDQALQSSVNSMKDGPVSKALYRQYWLEFACSNIKSRQWYEFRRNYWHKLDSGSTLSIKIDGEFKNLYERYHAQIATENSNLLGNDRASLTRKKEIEETVRNIIKVCRSLEGITYKSNVMRQACERFHDERFDNLIDSSANLFAVSNTVFEFVEQVHLINGNVVQFAAIPRPGKPEDYIATSSNAVWDAGYFMEHPEVGKVTKWVRQVFAIDDKLPHHFFKIIASFMYGGNPEKIFHVWSGANGNNSKTMLMRAIRLVMGPYFITADPALITTKTLSASGPSPDKARIRGRKGVVMNEPDATDKIHAGKVKDLTGGEYITGRMLNENGGEFENLAKLILIANRIPKIPDGGNAMINRMKVLPFLSTWCEDAPLTEEDQMRLRRFKIDPYFDRKLPDLSSALLWLMIYYYPIYRVEGLKDPDIVTRSNQNYWNESDYIIKFEREVIRDVYRDEIKDGVAVRVLDPNVKLSTMHLYNSFKSWFTGYYDIKNCPDEDTVRHDFTQRWKQAPDDNLRWFGKRVVEFRMMAAA